MLCEAKADFELLILLCLPPKFWDYRYALPCFLPVMLGMELTASCVIGNATLQTELQSQSEHGYSIDSLHCSANWATAPVRTWLSTDSFHCFKYFSYWVGKVKHKGWLRENRKQIASTAERWGQLALKEAILQSRDRKEIPPPSLSGAQLPNSVRLKNPPCFVRICKYQEEKSVWESPTKKEKEKKEPQTNNAVLSSPVSLPALNYRNQK